MSQDISQIPNGDYCYSWIETPSDKNKFIGKTKVCPYYKIKNVEGVEFPWCNYLELGGMPANGKWKGWENYEDANTKLDKHFDSNMDQKLSLSLLFDAIKYCGINKDN
jgi:hypothetical protein